MKSPGKGLVFDYEDRGVLLGQHDLRDLELFVKLSGVRPFFLAVDIFRKKYTLYCEISATRKCWYTEKDMSRMMQNYQGWIIRDGRKATDRDMV